MCCTVMYIYIVGNPFHHSPIPPSTGYHSQLFAGSTSCCHRLYVPAPEAPQYCPCTPLLAPPVQKGQIVADGASETEMKGKQLWSESEKVKCETALQGGLDKVFCRRLQGV